MYLSMEYKKLVAI